MFRICSEFSVMFRICSEFSAMFRICSESVQNFQQFSEFSVMFRIFSNFQNLFRIFSNVQNLFRIFSNFQTLFRISSTKTGLFRISWLCRNCCNKLKISIYGKNQACKRRHNYQYKYGQTCIKRSPLGLRKSGLIVMTGGLLKEVQFIWNFLWQDKKKVTF